MNLSEKMAELKQRMNASHSHVVTPVPPKSAAVQEIIDTALAKDAARDPAEKARTPSIVAPLLNSSALDALREKAAARLAAIPASKAKQAPTVNKIAATAAAIALAAHTTTIKNAEQTALSSLREKVEAAKLAKYATKTTELTLPTHIVQAEVIQKDKSQVTLEDLNEDQLFAIQLASEGKSFCLIGSAGSGKTTTVREMTKALARSGLVGAIPAGCDTKHLRPYCPSIVFISFTNQAVTNIKEAVPADYAPNCLTAHKLIEYVPEFFEIEDPVTHTVRNTMRYVPSRHSLNPIKGLTHVVLEESGSISVDLFDAVDSALINKPIMIFLGDLNQIPPVFGDAILGFKLLELPVVELKRSYRTDSDSPIRKLTYAILDGKPISDKQLAAMAVPGQLEIIRFKERVEWEGAVRQMGMHLAALTKRHLAGTEGGFNYEEDVVLIPFNKQLGTIELNKYIAQTITEHLGVPTYEIVVGIPKVYYAVGDIVYHNKTKCRIVAIEQNESYAGKSPVPPSVHLDRWGHDSNEAETAQLAAMQQMKDAEEDMEALFFALAEQYGDEDNEVSFRQASHKITLQAIEDDELPQMTISDVGAINALYLAYCLTVHKAQGSEWNNVFCIFHHSHSVMLKREILYTATTRARKKLTVYYSGEDDRPAALRKHNESVFQKGIIKQAIPGNTLEAKLKYFSAKNRAEAIKLEVERARQEKRAPDLASIKDDATIAKQLLNQLSHNELKNSLTKSGEQQAIEEMEDAFDE